MNAGIFVDTNVLLYAIDDDPASALKRHYAQQLLVSERWAWSVQVAAEFFVNATSPKRPFRLAVPDAVACGNVVCFPDCQNDPRTSPRIVRHP